MRLCVFPLQAVLDGRTSIVALLLDIGADASTPDQKGMTPLHVANDKPSIAFMLLKGGASRTAKNSNGRTPLESAYFNLVHKISSQYSL